MGCEDDTDTGRMRNDAAAADWSELQGDLLDQILHKVRCCLSLSDHIRFGGVCTNWRWIQTSSYNDDEKEEEHREMIKFPGQLPVLLIPYPSAAHSATTADHEEDEHGILYRFYNPKDTWLGLDHTRLEKPTRTVYSLYSGKVHNHDIQLPVPYYLNCRGSSHGWLVAVREDEDFSVRLLNPFRSVDNEIQLPPLTSLSLYYDDQTLREIIDSGIFVAGSHFLVKAVVSANPSSVSDPSELVVMIFYGNNRPALCRPGDASWTTLPNVPHLYEDAIFYRGQFYAIPYLDGNKQQVMAFDVNSFHHDDHPHPKLTEIARLPTSKRIANSKYLVESAGDLLQVLRYVGDDPDHLGFKKTVDFQIFKLDRSVSSSSSLLESNEPVLYKLGGHFQVFKLDSPSSLPESNVWVEIHALDGHTLFLGRNASMSLLAPPGGHGCKPDCIYFTDDYEDHFITTPSFGPRHMGVFNLEDRSIEPHYQMESKIIMPNAFWIQPML